MFKHDSPVLNFTTRNPVFIPPKDRYYPMTIAYSIGGVELFGTRGGITGYVWVAEVIGGKVLVRREDLSLGFEISARDGITQLDLAMDQNMHPVLTYVAYGKSYIYHFDGQTNSFAELPLSDTVTTPRVALDKIFISDIPQSDVVLGYTNNGKLCYRLQRERYLVEHEIATDSKKTMLWRMGRTIDNRLGFEWR